MTGDVHLGLSGLRRSVRHMTQHDLPPDIVTILEHLARWARGYDNHLKWNEEAKLKADLMNSRAQWLGFSAAAVRTKCSALGMREEDANLIAGLVSKAQAGKRLIPKQSYRDFRFSHEAPAPARSSTPGGELGPLTEDG